MTNYPGASQQGLIYSSGNDNRFMLVFVGCITSHLAGRVYVLKRSAPSVMLRITRKHPFLIVCSANKTAVSDIFLR